MICFFVNNLYTLHLKGYSARVGRVCTVVHPGVTMTLFWAHGRVSWSNQSLDREEYLLREIGAPRHIWLRWPGDVARGILWAGGNPCMTGCLECSLTRPVLALSLCQTATDGA